MIIPQLFPTGSSEHLVSGLPYIPPGSLRDFPPESRLSRIDPFRIGLVFTSQINSSEAVMRLEQCDAGTCECC
jgi:hypothetical protein